MSIVEMRPRCALASKHETVIVIGLTPFTFISLSGLTPFTFEGVVEKTRHAGLETCDTAGWEACATMVCHGFAGFTMKYPG
jgi:hypothetical protein